MKKPKTKLELDHQIANLIVKNWPDFRSQQFFADRLKVSQSQISRSLKKWNKRYPLKIEESDERNNDLEKKLREAYNLRQVIVLKSKEVHLKSYYEQVGMHASDLLVSVIPEIIEKMEYSHNVNDDGLMEPSIKIAGSDGDNVFACLSCLINDLTNTKLQIEIMPTIALRSKRLVELSPAHSLAQLLNLKPNVSVTNMYHLPEIDINNYEQMKHLVKQRITTVHRLKFNHYICKSDIVVLGIENVRRNFFGKGFPQFVSDMGLSDIIVKFNILGEVSFSPFNTESGFLFHYLRNTVFAPKNQSDDMEGSIDDWEFKYSLDEQIDLLRKISSKGKSIGKKDLFAVALLYCSIFTLNICMFEQFMNKDSNQEKPFVLIVAGGSSMKAEPLHYMLNRLKYTKANIIDGLVTSQVIAEKALDLNRKKGQNGPNNILP